MNALDLPLLEAAARSAGAAGATWDDGIRDAWRQLHYAAQAASEVGKSWSAPRADDSHSSLVWEGTALLGERVRAAHPFRAALDVPSFALSLRDETGADLATLPLAGETLVGALAWTRAEAARRAGPARQLAVADPVRVWPHHFDMAALAAVAPDRTIGVGHAVPDAVEPSGYWYVSPWAADAASRAGSRWPALAHGRWVDRGGPLRMAVFPLDAWSALPTPARGRALGEFLADAVGASRTALV